MKILVIDDELVSLAKMKAILEAYGECEAVSDGHEALKKYNAAAARGVFYDMVTIDIEMPGISGLEILDRLNTIDKDNGVRPSRKIIVSGSSTRDNVLKAAQLRCDGFLVKPITPLTVGERLSAMGISASEIKA